MSLPTGDVVSHWPGRPRERASAGIPIEGRGAEGTRDDVAALRYALGVGMVIGDWEIKRGLVARFTGLEPWETEVYRTRALSLIGHFAGLGSDDLGEKLERHRRRILEALVTVDLLGMTAEEGARLLEPPVLKLKAFAPIEAEARASEDGAVEEGDAAAAEAPAAGMLASVQHLRESEALLEGAQLPVMEGPPAPMEEAGALSPATTS